MGCGAAAGITPRVDDDGGTCGVERCGACAAQRTAGRASTAARRAGREDLADGGAREARSASTKVATAATSTSSAARRGAPRHRRCDRGGYRRTRRRPGRRRRGEASGGAGGRAAAAPVPDSWSSPHLPCLLIRTLDARSQPCRSARIPGAAHGAAPRSPSVTPAHGAAAARIRDSPAAARPARMPASRGKMAELVAASATWSATGASPARGRATNGRQRLGHVVVRQHARAAPDLGEQAAGGRAAGELAKRAAASRYSNTLLDMLSPAAVHQQQRVGRTLVPERHGSAREALRALGQPIRAGRRPGARALVDAVTALDVGRLRGECLEDRGHLCSRPYRRPVSRSRGPRRAIRPRAARRGSNP